jgi:AraC family transcriptional regulator
VKITIVERKPVRVAFMRYIGPHGEPLSRFWRRTVSPWLADHGLIDCPRFGLVLDNPPNTPTEKCRYDACVELPPGLTLPDAPEATIPGGQYATTFFKGTGADLGAAWGAFVSECHANRALRMDSQRLPFEHYPRGAAFDAKTQVITCELCWPVSS